MCTLGFPHRPGACPVPCPPRWRLPSETSSTCRQGGGREGGSSPPPCPALLLQDRTTPAQPASGDEGGTSALLPQCCRDSSAPLPSLSSSLHRGPNSGPSGKQSFIPPPIRKKTKPQPSPVPQAPLQKALCKGREQLWKSLIPRLISPRSPPGLMPGMPGAAAPAQPREPRGKSLPCSSY